MPVVTVRACRVLGVSGVLRIHRRPLASGPVRFGRLALASLSPDLGLGPGFGRPALAYLPEAGLPEPQRPVISPAKKIRPDRHGAATLEPDPGNTPIIPN
jgi:hypothetical protein